MVLLVIVAGYATYGLWLNRLNGPNTLTIYTYESLFGSCDGSVTQGLIAQFDAAYNAHVDVDCLGGTLVSTLLAQKDAPTADVVIGLDEITAPQAAADGLLVPYAAPALADVNASLRATLGPGDLATPYEWGYLAIDYNQSFAAATDGAVADSSFANFSGNLTWADQLMIEDPTVDITGEEFLLWEIAFEQSVVHDNWEAFWQSVDGHVRVSPDWGDAFTAFQSPPGNPMMVVSYGTDPAYAAYAGTPGAFNATVSWSNGTAYGWQTVYGLGIVNGTAHLTLAQEFVNWFLSPTVQSQIPENEWEYPANSTIGLPPEYAYAIDPGHVTPLNADLPAATIVSDLPAWLDTWQSIANQAG